MAHYRALLAARTEQDVLASKGKQQRRPGKVRIDRPDRWDVFAIIVIATVVSVGIARADVVGNVIDNEASLFAVALLLGLLFIGMGGLTILTLPHHLSLSAHKSKNPENLA